MPVPSVVEGGIAGMGEKSAAPEPVFMYVPTGPTVGVTTEPFSSAGSPRRLKTTDCADAERTRMKPKSNRIMLTLSYFSNLVGGIGGTADGLRSSIRTWFHVSSLMSLNPA